MYGVQLVLIVLAAMAISVHAMADWHKIFEQNNNEKIMDPNETLEELKQLAHSDTPISSEKDAPSKEQLEELVEFCNVSEDKCRAGYLRDLGIKVKYHAFTKQWTLNKYLDKCRQEQENSCTRNIDMSVEQALATLPSDKLRLINQMFDMLRGQQFSKGSITFATVFFQDYQKIFQLCFDLVELLEEQLGRYRWLKDENLNQLVSKQETERWLTNGERCKYFLANRDELVEQVAKYQERLMTQGRFADSRPAQRM